MRRNKRKTKHIFVTGGVVSSIGKGLTCACIGTLMEHRGLKVTLMKLDPYINVDPGTMNPFQHGEVFVLDDGAETDLDLGHYERFTTCRLGSEHNLTTGKVYSSVISKERQGKYLGATVQVIPHVTNEIKDHVLATTADVDVAIIEIGGTIGDIESLPFLEAVRQMLLELGTTNALSVHLTLVPYIAAAAELKTKPTQHSVQKLREIGIQPDILICRSDRPLEPDQKRKIGLFCNVPEEAVINAVDVPCIYKLPLALAQEELDDRLCEYLNIWSRATELSDWRRVVRRVMEPHHKVTIAMVGKYVDLKDSYMSLNEALVHGGIANGCRVEIKHIDAEHVEHDGAAAHLEGVDGVLVPGGFGERGIEGKIQAAEYARSHKLPYFGICLGMHVASVEFARHVLGRKAANSTEFVEQCPDPVIHLLPEQRDVTDKGATMRLGAYPCVLREGSLAHEAYRTLEISERHRHRYEFNNDYRGAFEEKGMLLSGTSPDGTLVEMIELRREDHPWYLACQFHPEFKSRPTDSHPLFTRFVAACLKIALEARDGEATSSEGGSTPDTDAKARANDVAEEALTKPTTEAS